MAQGPLNPPEAGRSGSALLRTCQTLHQGDGSGMGWLSDSAALCTRAQGTSPLPAAPLPAAAHRRCCFQARAAQHPHVPAPFGHACRTDPAPQVTKASRTGPSPVPRSAPATGGHLSLQTMTSRIRWMFSACRTHWPTNAGPAAARGRQAVGGGRLAGAGREPDSLPPCPSSVLKALHLSCT